MQLLNRGLNLTPSDLSAHLACPHLTTLELAVAYGDARRPGGRTELAKLIARKGRVHEAAFLDSLRNEGRDIVEVQLFEGNFDEAAAATVAAMRDAREVIYQATFARDGWRGRADFVRRVDKPSDLGEWSYEAWDTKLARSAKPAAVLQLVFYSQEIAHVQGWTPDLLHLVLGTGDVERYRPADFEALFRNASRRLQLHVTEPPPTYPWPCDHCSRCDFNGVCLAKLRADDHLSQVASIRRDQITKLNGADIHTLGALAVAPAELHVPRLAPPMLERLREQAGLQLLRRETGELRRQLLNPEPKRGFGLLPERSPGDVFFDMEGDPFFEAAAELEFLFGVLALEGNEQRYTAFRAHDRETERLAFEAFVDFVHARLREHPDLHVYHYATYEPVTLARLMSEHGTREEEVDELLRREVLIDLYQVVRQAIRAGVPSYSLKEVEQFFFTRRATVKSGDDAVLKFEEYLAGGSPSLLDEIEAYNEEDCLATLMLRDWLLTQKIEAETEFGVQIPFRPLPAGRTSSPESVEALDETARVRDALLVGSDPGDERWLMAHLLEYHRREARPGWWWYYRRRTEMDEDDLLEDAESIAGLVWRRDEPMPVKRSLEYTFAFPPQQHRFDPGDQAFDPDAGGSTWVVGSIDNAEGMIALRRGKARTSERLPTAIVPRGPYRTTEQRKALRRVATSVLAEDARYPALRRILRRDLPLDGATVQRLDLGEQRALALSLDRTYLFVQGPPGSGKTYRGARLIIALLRDGKRIGVAAQSHKAIHNLLDEIERAAYAEGFSFAGLKRGDGEEGNYDGDFVKQGPADINAYLDPDVRLIAGTAWLFSHEDLEDSLDVLVIDEAGQVSLADALAMGTAAQSLILLGDPLQLAQVTQGVHPPGSQPSVLEHLLGDADTIPEDRGIFLEQTRRMHPDVCHFISDAFYDSRLYAIPECAQRSTSLGVGIRWIPVPHEGNRVEAEQEAEAIALEIERILDGTFTDADEMRPLAPDDVMVVAPYNAQVRLLREQLPRGVEVGTVDKFQGREAPVLFYSMASSSGEDVPHGLEFLLSRNRLNVAISRAQCLAYLVCSPSLLNVNCRTIEQMRLANALCRFVELARSV